MNRWCFRWTKMFTKEIHFCPFCYSAIPSECYNNLTLVITIQVAVHAKYKKKTYKVLNSIKVDDGTYCEIECRCFSLIEIKTICFCRHQIDRVDWSITWIKGETFQTASTVRSSGLETILFAAIVVTPLSLSFFPVIAIQINPINT